MTKCFGKKIFFFAFRAVTGADFASLAYLREAHPALSACPLRLSGQTRAATEKTGAVPETAVTAPEKRPAPAVPTLTTTGKMLTSSRGLVLRTIKYKDDAHIVDIYTEEEGTVSFLVRVSTSRRATVKSRLFRPMAMLHVEWNKHPASRLQRIKAARPDYIDVSIAFDAYKTSIALFLAEFLHCALREAPADRPLYAYLRASVVWLDLCAHSFANFHLVFLLRMTRFLGIYPNLSHHGEGQYFDLETGQFTDQPPLHNHFLMPADAARLPLLMRMNYDTMHLFRFGREERQRLLTAINDYYRLHLPAFPDLKSLDVLHELFS